jgi:hypothetical protein
MVTDIEELKSELKALKQNFSMYPKLGNDVILADVLQVNAVLQATKITVTPSVSPGMVARYDVLYCSNLAAIMDESPGGEAQVKDEKKSSNNCMDLKSSPAEESINKTDSFVRVNA